MLPSGADRHMHVREPMGRNLMPGAPRAKDLTNERRHQRDRVAGGLWRVNCHARAQKAEENVGQRQCCNAFAAL
jgi:hypothetical protein